MTEKQEKDSSGLLDWLMPKIKEWRQYRDDNYKSRWDEYYRLWRGIWDASDKARDSERSRLISPALQQAVEGSVAEMEEATFGRDQWFDIRDDIADRQSGQDKEIDQYREQLKEDLEKEGIKKEIAEAMLNGALYGTGIGEILVEENEELIPNEKAVLINGQASGMMARGVEPKKYICVKLNPVSPYNFSSDPGISDIDSGLGCEVTDIVAEHKIKEGIKDGRYVDVDFGSLTIDNTFSLPGETKRIPADGKAKLTRYYGKVPKNLLDEWRAEAKGEEVEKKEKEDEDETLVEAIVTIANDTAVLAAKYSPYMMQDRPVVAYQHDTVPGRFWGRGVCEKGYNAQKALDTELRARADNLALSTHPMMGIDASRLPRGVKPKVQPGATILTNGNPKEILMPFNFGTLNPISYKESAELERMVTMGTGTMDSAAPLGVNPRNNTLGGMSIMQAASIKRQKRTLANFQDRFLIPLIRKALFRFMQFDPDRYPVFDPKVIPYSSMGIMARELETQNLVTMLGYVPPESPAAALLIRQVLENSSFPNRAELLAAFDEMMKPKPPQPDPKAVAAELQAKVAMDANDVQRQRLALDAQNSQADRVLKVKELDLQEKEIDLREKEILVNAAQNELTTRVKAVLESQRTAATQ